MPHYHWRLQLYGALGRVPPRFLTNLFLGHFGTAQCLTATMRGYLLQSVTAAAIV